MPQYWIQTPVENAKEVVQRYLDANSGLLTLYAGATVSYDQQCEVVFYPNELPAGFQANVIFFGNFVLANDETSLAVVVTDESNINYILDCGVSTAKSGIYKSIIWNSIDIQPSSGNAYFIGYKFNITTP